MTLQRVTQMYRKPKSNTLQVSSILQRANATARDDTGG